MSCVTTTGQTENSGKETNSFEVSGLHFQPREDAGSNAASEL